MTKSRRDDYTHIVAVDPGKMTGVVIEHVPTGDLHAGQADLDDFSDWCAEFYAHPEVKALVVYERFVISGRTVQSGRTDENWSIELIGLARHMCRWYGHTFELQGAADAKKFAPNDLMREAGVYVKGKDHANDALRHYFLAVARHFNEPPPWVVHRD